MDAVQHRAATVQLIDQVAVECENQFRVFLEKFKKNDELKYTTMARTTAEEHRRTCYISYVDLNMYDSNLADMIFVNYYKYYNRLCQVVSNFVNDVVSDNPRLQGDFIMSISEVPSITQIRHLHTRDIGRMVKIRAQIVRTHPVHPELVSGTFRCKDCNTEIRDVEQQFKYMEPTICFNTVCGNRSRFELLTQSSKFVDFQKMRAQETQVELPRGCIPRSVEIIIRHDQVESAQPGDKCELVGSLIVIPDVNQFSVPGGSRVEEKPHQRNEGGGAPGGITGLKQLGVRELGHRLAFWATSCHSNADKFTVLPPQQQQQQQQSQGAAMDPAAAGGEGRNHPLFSGSSLNDDYVEFRKRLTHEEMEEIVRMSDDPQLFPHLCESLFPTIRGSDEVKRGILLMMFGGVPKITKEGTHLRGNLNVCVVGDPSTAKSQFLKQVECFAPSRCVYTSGKASTAAGLTAAVVRDEETGEFVIEAGALMLADNGICCIDEFDKMEVADQVAIHEAMEQQTISITKAGVKASLNARTSILAAANPIGGRYERSRSLKQNISLSAPLMSRFDLFFVLVDQCNELADYAIARSIVDLHQTGGQMARLRQHYPHEKIRRYIAFARCFKPKVSIEAQQCMVECYRKIRQRDAATGSKSAWRITVRQLESLVRLSEASARLHCGEMVLREHVEEAFNLLNKSIIRVDQPDIHLDDATEMQHQQHRGSAAADGHPDDGESVNGGMNDTDLDASVHTVDISELGDTSQIGAAMEQDTPPSSQQGGEDGRPPDGGRAAGRPGLSLSYPEYKRICALLIYRIHECDPVEADAVDGNEEAGSGHRAGGNRRSELVNWYLQQIEDTIQSEEELLVKKMIVEKVLDRLIRTDRYLLTVHDMDEEENNDPVLMVHPNYTFE